jgi:hypothetical protein
VANITTKRPKSQKLLAAGKTVLALVIGLVCIQYHTYAYAIAWHCFHGNCARLTGGYQVSLPILWWKQDSGAYHRSLLVRASKHFLSWISVSYGSRISGANKRNRSGGIRFYTKDDF